MTNNILDAKITEKKLVNKYSSDEKIKTLVTKEEIKTLATMVELKAEQDKIVKLETHGVSYFLGKKFLGDNGPQNMFIYQPTYNTLELKKDMGTDYVLSVKSKGVYTSKLEPLYTAFLQPLDYLDIE